MSRADEADIRHRQSMARKSTQRKAVRAMKATFGNRKLPDWYIRPDGTKPEKSR